MIKTKSIERVLCPICNRAYLVLRTLGAPADERQNDKEHWVCPECPNVFPKGYFETFRKFDRFIARTKDEVEPLEEMKKEAIIIKQKDGYF